MNPFCGISHLPHLMYNEVISPYDTVHSPTRSSTDSYEGSITTDDYSSIERLGSSRGKVQNGPI